MTALLMGGSQRIVDAVLSEIRAAGLDAVGVSDENDAVSRLEAGGVDALVIGGGIEQESRDRLERRARVQGAEVITGALGNRDIGEYVRQDIVPVLREVGTGTR